MERKQIEGQWWLPENRDSKVPGTLVIEEDRIELSLLGALRDHRASAVAQENPDGSTAFTFTEESMEQDGVYPRILGEAGGKAYTLEDCFQTRRTNLFGGGLQTQRVNVHSVFEGLHFDPEEPVEFSEIVVRLDGLVMFVQRSGLSETIETKDVDGQVQFLGHTVTLAPVATEEFEGINGSTCRLVHIRTTGGADFLERHVSQDFVVHVKFAEKQPSDDLLAIASHLQDLVTVATGRRAAFVDIELRHPDIVLGRKGKPALTLPIKMYATWLVKPEKDKKRLNSHDVVFTLDDLGGVDAITKWLQVAEKHASALGRVMVARYSDSSYASDNLLNSAAALEGYHRDKYEEGKDTGTNFVDRIKKCIEVAGDVFTDLVPDTEMFAKLLKKNRVAVAHHLSGAEGSTQQIFLSRAAAWLLLICLLRDAGSPEQVFVKIKDRQDWRWLKRQVAEVLREAGKQAGGSELT